MNNSKKRAIALSAILCAALAVSAGCSNKNNSSEEPITGTPFTHGKASDGVTYSIDTPSVTPEGSDTSIEVVTDAAGQPVTEVVYGTETVVQPVTDEAGEPVTDEAGEPVTEEVVQTATQSNGELETSVVQVTTEVTNTSANAVMDGVYTMWVDISKNENYFFNGDMIVATFKVKDNAPAGDYTIRVATDFATVAGQSVYTAENFNGTIRVGNGSIDVDDHASDDRFIYYAKNASCNAGDEVQVYFGVRNNPGVVAFNNWFYYDTNVFEFIDVTPTGEYADIAKNTSVGTKPAANS